jgi:hypothetical protein
MHYPKSGTQPVVWFDPEVLALHVDKKDGVENEHVLNGTPEQAAEGLRRYRQWKDSRAAMVAAGSVPRYRIALAESLAATEQAEAIAVETVTLHVAADRPTGRRFGRVVHDILQHAGRVEEIPGLAVIWGRRHGAAGIERDAAAVTAHAALEYINRMVPAGALRYRELPVMVRLEDGTIVDGRVDFAWSDGTQWTVVDYKTDRRERRNVSQVQAYGLALQKATGLKVRGLVLEV